MYGWLYGCVWCPLPLIFECLYIYVVMLISLSKLKMAYFSLPPYEAHWYEVCYG